MKYELYEQIQHNRNKVTFYKFETDNLISLSSYMENHPLANHSKYIVIKNDAPKPLNYTLLGFTNKPTEKEHYDIILECKLAKEYCRQIKEIDFDDNYLNYETTEKLSTNIFSIAKLYTDFYFEKYNHNNK